VVSKAGLGAEMRLFLIGGASERERTALLSRKRDLFEKMP